jgi:hypothetical protein
MAGLKRCTTSSLRMVLNIIYRHQSRSFTFQTTIRDWGRLSFSNFSDPCPTGRPGASDHTVGEPVAVRVSAPGSEVGLEEAQLPGARSVLSWSLGQTNSAKAVLARLLVNPRLDRVKQSRTLARLISPCGHVCSLLFTRPRCCGEIWNKSGFGDEDPSPRTSPQEG